MATKKKTAKKSTSHLVSWDKQMSADPIREFKSLEEARKFALNLLEDGYDDDGDTIEKDSIRVWEVKACFKVKTEVSLEEVK